MEKFIRVGMKIFKEWKNLLELDDKVTLCLGLLSPPLILSSSRIHKVRKFLLYLSMKLLELDDKVTLCLGILSPPLFSLLVVSTK